MSQNQNKQHLHQQLEHHQLQQQQHHHHQQQLLHHHHQQQQQQQQQQQRQWHQQYQQQQQQLHHHHQQQQQQQQQQQAQYAAAAAAHAHVAAATGMRSGNGMPGMFGNTLGRGGCLYDTSGGSGGGGGFDLDMAGHHIGSGNASAIAATSTTQTVGVGIAGGAVGGYMPPHVNVSSVAGGAYNAGMSGMSTASESGRRASVGGCAYTQATQSQPPPPQQPQQQQQQQHAILPPERIKMEPLEQILTPTIEMEELIIKTEPTDDAYNKVSTVDEAIATGSTNMIPNAGYMNFPKHLQSYPQHQHPHPHQQQQLVEQQKHQQKLQHQQQMQQQHLQQQHLQQLQQQREQQLQQQMLSHDAMAEAGLLTVKLEPQIHIKEEMPEASQNKPLNFPRRKVQTERSDTLPICQRCKQVFFKKQSYSKHVSQSLCEIVEYDFKCSICPMSFTSSEELQTHEQLHRENMYFCHKYCGKYFDTIELCEVHEYMQHEYVNYICNVCSAGFASRDLLFAHMPQHRNQPRYDCPVCRLWFHTAMQLHQHRIQAPYFCGKFYRRPGGAAGGAPFGPVPPTHSANYNLQDCSMGIIEMPNSNSFSSYLQNRAFHHQHPAPPHPPLPPQQLHPHLAQQQHLQRQQLHLQQQHAQFPAQPLHAVAQPQPTPAQPDFMRRNSLTGASGGAATEFQMPQIKTEIKVEPDIYGTTDYPLQTPLPPPPLPPPPLSAAQQQSALASPARARRFGDYSNESFGAGVGGAAGGGGGDSSLAFGSLNNSGGSNSNSNDFPNSNTSSLQRSMSASNAKETKPTPFPVGNFQFPTTPSVSRTRVVDTGEDGAVCCVPHCGVTKQSSPTLQFFTFPKDEKYLHQWLHNLKMFPEADSTYSQYRICSLHFPKRCINRYSLCYWAVPTFNLGHDDVANLYQNREITNTFTIGERAQCSMPGCPSQRGESNCKFYNFPNDMKTRIKWCQNARLPVNSREPRHFCSRHFEDRCFGKFRLKPWAVPTLHLGTPYGRIHDNPGVFYLEEKKCCLPHCKRTRSSDFNLSLYRFPRDEVLLRRWCYNLRLDPAIYRGKNHKICSAHFIKEALGLRKLSPGAVPTLNLGHNDRFNIYENELPTPPVVPPSKMFNFHNMSAPPSAYNSQRQSLASSSSHSERMYPNPVSKLKFSISNITAGDVSTMSGSATQNMLDSLEVCFVPSCKRNRNVDNVTLHTIPRRPEQMRKWCHNLKIGIETLHKGVRICSAHFEPYCIGGCMRPFAVPTLNLGHDDPNIYRNPDVIKKLNIRETCCVQDCKRNRDRDHANLHRFPSNFDMLTKWCENLLKPVPDGTKLFNDAICEVHFADRCIRNKRLEKWAVPTVKLGHNEEPKHRLPTDEEIAEQWPKPVMPNKGMDEGECCVSTCRRDPKIDDVKLYRTPEDPELLAKWAHNLQTEAEDLTTLRICSLHFEEHCFSKKRRLHYWALPTLNLANNVEQLYENPEPVMPPVIIKSETKRERRMRDANEPLKPWTPRCCLSHCRKRRDTDHVQLFRFPILNRPMLAKWCHNLQLPLVGNGHRRLCSTHFEPRVLSKRCPIPMSVPTLDLNTPPGYKIYMNPARLKAVKLQQVCCISSCSRTRADGVQLFRFPHSRSVLRKWCHNTRQHARGEYRVCSRHFEPHAFGAKRLMPGAIPTLNLDPEVEDVYANEAQSFAETQCVVSGCVASKELDGVRLFKFPSDDVDLLWKWCNNLKMNPLDCRGVRICNRHFEPECVGPKMLYKWAVPTLALGHNDADIKLVSVPPPEARYSDVVTKCCVPTCGKSRKYDDAQMNSFPKNLRLFRCWKHNLKLDFLDFKDREKYKICSDHFEPVCLGKLRLNYGAIPTLNLGHDDTDDLYPVDPAQIQVSLFGKMRPRIASDKDAAELEMAGCVGKDDVKCSYPNCTATKMLLSEPYDMPAALPLLALWCAQMKVDTEALSESPKLCGLHFIKLYKSTLDAANALVEGDNELSEAMKSLNATYDKCCASPIVCSAQCCVAGCGSNQISGSHTAQRLYLFPTAAGGGLELLEKWCHNVDVAASDLSRFTHRVCARHFETQCIGPTQRLRSWAIPTLQLNPKPEHKIHAIPELGSAARPHEARCCVSSCARERGDFETMRLFSFPIIDEVLEKWLHNLQLTRNQCARLRICEQHFEPRCIVKTRLLRWAVPTLQLERNVDELLPNAMPMQAAASTASIVDEVDAIDAASNNDVDDEMLGVDDNEEDDNGSGELAAVPNVKMKKSLGIAKCCVSSCRRTRLQHGVRLFPFPTSHQILRKWCHNLKISLEKATDPALRICSLHFHKRCIDGKELRPWAKPTNALGHTGPIYENPKNLPGVFLPKCCLPHCRQRRTLENDLRTFGFPKDETLLRKWCANLRMEPRANHARICMSHFPPEAMGNKKLRANAVPTLNVGHNEPLEYDNALLIATASKTRNPLEERKILNSDASDAELGNNGEYDDIMDDDNDDDDDYRIDEEDDENDFYASAGIGNSDDDEEEETVEDFTPSISAATGDDDELYSNVEARHADNFIVDSADEDEERAEVEDEEDIYGNDDDDDEDDSDESDESVAENVYNNAVADEESDSESEPNAAENNADGKNAAVDDDDVEMLIDADDDEDDKSSYNACDPLDFVECVNQSDDTQQHETTAISTKSSNTRIADKNARKRPISTTLTNYEDDSNTNYSNADETTRFTATTSNSASATTSSASASAAAGAHHCGAEKINRSVFRLCCLRHRRKKKAPPDPPPDLLMNSIARGSLRRRQQRAYYCAVRRCGRAAGAAVTLYRFPLVGSSYCRRWCAQLKVKMSHAAHMRICQRHFAYSLVDRRRRRLRFGAIPTRNLHNMAGRFKRNPLYGLHKNTAQPGTELERDACAHPTQAAAAQLNVYNRCCVPHCGKSHQVDGVTLFRFPKLRSLYLQWATNLRLMPTTRLVQVYKVCSEHFEHGCLSYQRNDRAKLKYGSVPTLKLGHNDTLKIYKHNTLSPQKRRGVGRRKWRPLKGVNECAVHDCKVAQFLQMQLFALPAALKLQERWCNYFKLNCSGASENASEFFENVRLCALHYMEGYQMATYSDGTRGAATAALDELEANYARITSSTRIQMLKCCVPNCSTKFTDNVRLTAFPSAEELRAKWQHNTQVSFSPSHRYLYKVCALHFEERCFAKKRLFMWAIPTLHLPKPAEDAAHKLFENPNIDVASAAQCCIEGCATNEIKPEPTANEDASACKAAVRFWHFPQDDALRNKWCHNLGLATQTSGVSHTSRRWRICSRHFEPFCFGKTLRSWAVPTLELPKPVKHTKAGKRSTYIYQNPDTAALYYRCCIKTCHQLRDLDAGIRLYAFPKKDTMLQKWAHNIRMPAVKCRYARICTLHFEAQCLRPQMQPWALPTIDLGHEEADIFRVPKVKLMVTSERCCLPHCSKRRSRDKVHLFTFPRDKAVLDKWWHNLAIGVQDVKRRLICEAHFEPRCISKRRLKRWAIPTLNLGHTNETLENPTPAEVLAYENNTTMRRSQTPSRMARAKPTQTTPTSSLQKCSITSCARGVESSALYRFPKPDWLRKKWCDNTRIGEEAAKLAKICASHFEPQVMGNRKPRPWALPTLELGADENGAPLPAVHANPKQLSRFHPEEHEWGELRYVRANHCAIISCMKSKKDGVTLFNYPTKRHMLQKWAENCRHYPYQAKRYRFQLCGAHFTADCFKREGTRLRKGAVPTLNLGHDDAQIHQSEFESVSGMKIETKILKSCSVPQCGRTNLHDGVRLFKFPYERAEILEKWCHNLRMHASECRNALICNMHFEARCVGGGHRALLLRALPTLLLGHNDPDILHNPETFERPEKVISCCVPDCMNTKQTPGVTLSAFPKLRSHFEKWAHNLQLPVNTTVWHTYKICSAHFESYCYEHGRIKVGAMPTLNLGHNNAIDLYTVSAETMSNAFKRKRVAPKSETSRAPLEMCCYPACREMELRLTNQLFEFPTLDAVRRAWYESVGLSAEVADEAKCAAIEVETQDTACVSETPLEDAVATAAAKVTKKSPKLCPMHFKLLYIEHAAMLAPLKSAAAPETQRTVCALEETYATVCDLSCVRRISCAVPGCHSNYLTTKSLKFFKFPDNAEMRAKWCHNTQVTIDADRLYCYKICELHFEANCTSQLAKKVQRLKHWALPTLQLPPRAEGAPALYALPPPDMLAETKRASLLLHTPLNKCCIPSCVYAKALAERAVGADSEIQFFNFPNDAELLYKWVYNTQISMVAATNARICSLHFEKHCINKRLRMYAVPTLLLGHQKTDIYTNPDIYKRVPAEACESKPPKLPKYYEDNIGDDVADEDEDEESDEELLSQKLKLRKSEITKYKTEALVEREARATRKSTAYDERKLDSELLEPMLVVKTELRERKQQTATTTTSKSATAPKPYHQPFIINIKQEKDVEENYTAEGIENQMKQGLLDMFNSFGDAGTEQEPDDITELGDEATQMERDTARHCRIHGCNSYARNAGVTLFKFPFPLDQFRKWLHNTQLEVDYTRRWRYRICHRHFEPVCMQFRKLPPGTMPTLNLGPKRPAHIYENEFDVNSLSKYKMKTQQQNMLATTTTATDNLLCELKDEADTNSSYAAPTHHDNADASADYNDDYADFIDNTPIDRDTSRHCRIPDCNSHAKDPGVTLFKFPMSEYLFHKWLYNTQLKVDYTRRWRYRICQRHFEPICMQFRKLPPGTMPTLNLGPSRPERIYENSFDINHLKKFKIKLKNNATTSAAASATTTSAAIMHPSHIDYNDDIETNSSYAVDANTSNNAQLPLLSCTVRNCTSTYHALHEGLHLHKLPTNIMLREKWIYNCRFSEETLVTMSSRIRICSLHFSANCYYGVKRQLKFGSVPTLRLGHTDPNVYSHGFSTEGEAQLAVQHHNVQRNWRSSRLQSSTDANQDICCLINCQHSRREYTRHFAFPVERELLEQWLSALGMEFNSARPDDYKICEWHFKASDFDGEVLRADAVPTRNLKLDDANQTEEEDDDNDDEDDELDWNANEEPLDERPSTSAAAAAAASTTTADGYNKLIPGSRRCCLAHCRKQLFQDNVRTFKFPTMHEQFEKWVHNLGIKYDGDAPWRYQICSEHFENQCIIHYENKAKLFRWAVPTLNLGKHAPAILFTNENPRKLQQQDADYGGVYKTSNADQLDNDETMDTTNDELSSAPLPTDAPKHMAYQQEDMDLLAPIERPPHKMSGAAKRSNYAYTASNEDGDDYYDGAEDAYDTGDGENSLLNVIREEKPSAVKEGTPALSFFSLQLVRGGSAKVRACCLPHCGRTRESGVRLFRFPTEPVFLKRWEYNLRVLFNESQRNTHLICSAHFERGQYNKRLVVDAIPTLNLGHNSSDIYRNGQYEPTRMQRRAQAASPARMPAANSHKPLHCNVPACADAPSKRRLFPFPSNHVFVKIWAERTQIAYDARQHAELRVCELHFENDCFSAHGLNNNAVPTLFLPAPNALPASGATTKALAPIGRTAAMPKLSAIACSVTNCGNSTATRTDLKIFSKFPDDFELFTKWCFNLKIDPRTYVDGSYNVCSEHFEAFCIGGHSLRVWAVPTLRLGHNSKLIHNVERPAEMETKCCLPHCGRKKSKDGVEFYSFPKAGDSYRQWCQILKIDEGLYRNSDKKICSAHFRADCFNSNGTLRLGARPTMLLRNRTATAAAHMLKPPAPYRSKCIVRICHEMQQLYSFPAQRQLCTKWCHNLKIDYYPKLHENMNFKICRRHFEPNCLLSGGKLHAEAVPTVQLGHNDVNIYQNLVGIKHSASTPSYDDNSSLRTSVSTVHNWLMDVDTETNAANSMPTADSGHAATAGGGGAEDDLVRMEYEPPVDLEPTVVTENIADDNLDLGDSAYMQMEDDTYYADFEEQRLLPQSSTFIAAESTEVIDLDAVDAVQEQFPNWSQDNAVLVDDDDEDEDDDGLLWPLN